MKKRLAPVIVSAALLFAAAGASAQTTQAAVPTVTPASSPFFYNLKIFFEDVKQGVLHFASPKGEAAYLQERIDERAAEQRAIYDDFFNRLEARDKSGGQEAVPLNQDAILRTANLAADEWQNLVRVESAPSVRDRAIIQKVPTTFVDPKGTIAKAMQDRLTKLRQDLLEAKAAGDDAKVQELLAQLKQGQSAYIQDLDLASQSAKTANDLWGRVLAQLSLGPNETVIEAGRRAEAVKQQIKDEEEKLDVPAALRTNFDDLDKKIAAAQQEAAKPDARRLPIGDFLNLLLKKPDESAKNLKAADEQKKLPEEKPATPAPAPQQQAPKAPATPPQQAPQQKPTLKKIPSDTISRSPLQLVGDRELNGTVGEPFSYQFDAQGGLPPYHYQLDTAGGFPPFGVILDVYGTLSGTPTADGTRDFRVCVVDTTGKSDCPTITMTVAAPAEEFRVTITSVSCDQSKWPDPVRVEGEASGPVGSQIETPSGQGPDSCASWHTSGSASYHYGCTREAGDPDTTSWSINMSADMDPSFYSIGPLGSSTFANPCK